MSRDRATQSTKLRAASADGFQLAFPLETVRNLRVLYTGKSEFFDECDDSQVRRQLRAGGALSRGRPESDGRGPTF